MLLNRICFLFLLLFKSNQLKRQIPNFITLLNLLSGCIAVIFAVNGHLVVASFFVCLGIFFDFFDGLLARKLNVQSELGVQLDSLADMVTSGVVPGLIMYQLLSLSDQSWTTISHKETSIALLPFVGLFIALASAYRLANFNISTEQSDSFIGLPTPANALLIISFPLILEFQNNDLINSIIVNPWFLMIVTLLSCYLLNANIRLLALKFKTWRFQDNATRYILIILSVILLIIFQFAAIPLIIITYIVISLLNKK